MYPRKLEDTGILRHCMALGNELRGPARRIQHKLRGRSARDHQGLSATFDAACFAASANPPSGWPHCSTPMSGDCPEDPADRPPGN
jgi:hypothetical protein